VKGERYNDLGLISVRLANLERSIKPQTPPPPHTRENLHVTWDDKVTDFVRNLPPNPAPSQQSYEERKIPKIDAIKALKSAILNPPRNKPNKSVDMEIKGGAKVSFYIDGKKRTQKVHLNERGTKP